MTASDTAPTSAAPTYHVLGVPYRTGSFTPGSEHDAQPYRDAGLIARLQAAGCHAIDDGDIPVPSYLPHHEVPPVRSWPGPRIAWEIVADRLAPLLAQPGHVPLLIGCDCSIVVGTTQALMRAAGQDQVHVLYVDGDRDDATPDPAKSQSAAYLALWLATHGQPFRAGPEVPPSHVTVIGPSANDAAAANDGPRVATLADIRRDGARTIAQRSLDGLPASASLVLHLDIDVFAERELPAAYFPHRDGLTLGEGRELLDVLLRDPRIRIIEVSEYASLRDFDRRSVTTIIDLVAHGLARRQR
jgi:arginase